MVMKNSGEDLHMEFPLTIGTKPARDKNTGIVPSISFGKWTTIWLVKPAFWNIPTSTTICFPFAEEAADHVEGGMYISPEFQIGQVYDGTTGYGDSSTDDVVLYRPTYVKVGPERPPVPSTSRGVHHNDVHVLTKIPAFVKK